VAKFKPILLALVYGLAWQTASAKISIEIKDINSMRPIGSISAEDTPYGLLITPALVNLPPGLHGFHVHTKANCADQGKAAGGHFDPEKTNKHRGPYQKDSHLGDLPALYVDKNGEAKLPVLAPRLKSGDLNQRAIIIHQGGDNYSDMPKMLGGGGDRIACGIVNIADHSALPKSDHAKKGNAKP